MGRPNGAGPARGSSRVRAWAAAVALFAGAWLVHDGTAVSAPPQPPAAASDAHGAVRVVPVPGTVAPLAASAPVRLRIPAIRVDAPVTEVGLDGQRRLEPPKAADRDLVGWYRGGVSPGETGTAVTVGHVDNRQGPAVFYRLGLLRPGHTVEVLRRDGRWAVFTVDAVRSYSKAAFPDAEVYSAASRPELRLLTCGGRYDRRSGYQANTVVFAHLTATRRGGAATTGWTARQRPGPGP